MLLTTFSFSGLRFFPGHLNSPTKKQMKKVFTVLALAVSIFATSGLRGQNMHISSNLLDYLNLGTINGEFGLSPTPKWTIYLRGRYNPFTYKMGKQVQNRVACGAAGARYWFWYSNSGWFADSNISFTRFNTGGIIDRYAYEGDAVGVTIGAGYALMLSRRWNLNFGLGIQGGYTAYTKYGCAKCGKVMGKYEKFYVVPSNIMVQLLRIL